MDVIYSPYRAPDTGSCGFVVTARDITEHMRAEEALWESEGRAKAVLETAVDGIITINERGMVESFNVAAERMFGYTADEVVGHTVTDLMPLPYRAEHDTYIKNYLETGQRKIIGIRREVIGQRKNGATFPIDLSVSEIMIANRHLFTGVARDITERKRLEDELKQRTHDLGERFKELNCLYVISKLAEQRDITTEEILEGTVDVIPSSWQYPSVTKARVTLGGRVYSTADFRESQWRQASEIVVQGEPIGRVEVFYLTEQPTSDEGPFLKEERSLIDAIAERLGRTIERARLGKERATLKEQLHQAQKMEAIAQLAGGVAHDFNNLLTVIGGYVSKAKKALPDDHKAVESLRRVQEAADQAAGVTRSLLTFSHKMETKKEPIELQASLDTALRLLRQVLTAGIEVLSDAADEQVWVRADGTQLQQIIMNLAINARDAMPNGGTLRISVSQSARPPIKPATLDEPARLVAVLVVSDTGTGMEPDVRDRIFEPFFTTKPRGQGTGLGLAIIHSIVEDHDGSISVESKAGQGTTFTVELPLLDLDTLWDTPREVIPPKRGRGEVVLLAEDNRHVRGILASSLESLGYEVVQATDGSSLMDCFELNRDRVELLVMDVDLPKRGGLECLRDIRSSGGCVPAIIITGSVGPGLEQRIDDEAILLRKPFQIADFTALAGTVLGERQREKQT